MTIMATAGMNDYDDRHNGMMLTESYTDLKVTHRFRNDVWKEILSQRERQIPRPAATPPTP